MPKKLLKSSEYIDDEGKLYAPAKVKRPDRRYSELKEQAIETKGGKCHYCGYDKCPSAMHFHHTDPNNKMKNVSRLISQKKSWAIIEEELKKTILVCANCHAEIHAGV